LDANLFPGFLVQVRMSSFVDLDDSESEGGGQILRSLLALSILTRGPFRLINIRANRPLLGARAAAPLLLDAKAR
jgi:RNA 3'-terminal phosphate cyclase (ATP)